MKRCELDPEKICDDCGECDICDLDPKKICDNCCRCLGEPDYSGVTVDEIIVDDSECDLDDFNDEIGNDFDDEFDADPGDNSGLLKLTRRKP